MMERKDNPDETDFPLIDRCIVCDGLCDWQPRYEMACRTPEHNTLLASLRPLGYVPGHRVVKFCIGCIPDDNDRLRRQIRKYYPAFAKKEGI